MHAQATALPVPAIPQLRDYQHDAIDAANAALARGIRRFIIEMPTASGKTMTFATWALRDIVSRGGRALVVAPTDETIRQAVETFQRLDPTVPIGVVKAERAEYHAPVVVASVQTLSKPGRLRQVTPDFALVVFDEAHHAAATTYKRILAHVGASDPIVTGWTATAFRADKAKLVGPAGVFQEVALELPIAPMIRDGWLCDLLVRRYQLGFDLDLVARTAGDYSARSLANVMSAANPLPYVVTAYHQELDGKRALAYTPTVEMADALAREFRVSGIPAEFLSGETPIEERRALLSRLGIGETLVVTNCGVLTEGFDAPWVEGIINLRPTTSRVLFRQIIGRGLRKPPGKTLCKILDFAGATRKHDLMSVAKAVGVDVRDGETVIEALTRAEVEAAQAAAADEERTRLIAERVELFRQGQAQWACGKDGRAFSLWLGGSNNIDVVPDLPDLNGDERWRVLLASSDSGYRPNGFRRFVRPIDKLLGYGLTLTDTVALAEAYAHNAGQTALVNRQQRTTPATDGQRRVWVKHQAQLGPVPDGLTVAQASQALGGLFAEKREQARQRGTRRVAPIVTSEAAAGGQP